MKTAGKQICGFVNIQTNNQLHAQLIAQVYYSIYNDIHRLVDRPIRTCILLPVMSRVSFGVTGQIS